MLPPNFLFAPQAPFLFDYLLPNPQPLPHPRGLLISRNKKNVFALMIHMWRGQGGIRGGRGGDKVVINLIPSFMKNANAGINLGFLSSLLANRCSCSLILKTGNIKDSHSLPRSTSTPKVLTGVRCRPG